MAEVTSQVSHLTELLQLIIIVSIDQGLPAAIHLHILLNQFLFQVPSILIVGLVGKDNAMPHFPRIPAQSA